MESGAAGKPSGKLWTWRELGGQCIIDYDGVSAFGSAGYTHHIGKKHREILIELLSRKSDLSSDERLMLNELYRFLDGLGAYLMLAEKMCDALNAADVHLP